MVELEGVDATVSLGTDGSIEILQESPDDPVVLTAVAGTPTVTVDGEEITLDPGESIVTNVPPSVAADNATVTVNEGQSAAYSGTFSGTGDDVVSVTASIGTVSQVGTLSGTWSWEFDSSDGPDDGQTVVITATDNDGDFSTTSFLLVVDNVAPDVILDTSLAADLPGGLAFLGRKGVDQSHSAFATDSGDDDLTFDWSFGALTIYPADGSPPSEAIDTATVTFSAPGVYTVEVVVTDDDWESDSESLTKLVVDDCDCTKSQGFWKREFKTRSEKDLKKVEKGKLISEETLESYLDIIRFASSHFGVDAVVPLKSFEDANLILNGNKGNTGSGNGNGSGSNQALETGSNNKKKKKKKGDSSGGGDKDEDGTNASGGGDGDGATAAANDGSDTATSPANMREKVVRQTRRHG